MRCEGYHTCKEGTFNFSPDLSSRPSPTSKSDEKPDYQRCPFYNTLIHTPQNFLLTISAALSEPDPTRVSREVAVSVSRRYDGRLRRKAPTALTEHPGGPLRGPPSGNAASPEGDRWRVLPRALNDTKTMAQERANGGVAKSARSVTSCPLIKDEINNTIIFGSQYSERSPAERGPAPGGSPRGRDTYVILTTQTLSVECRVSALGSSGLRPGPF